jgi:hypothetical protein
VFENRVLRRIFGQHRDEVPGGEILHNEELVSFARYSENKSKRMTWGRHVASVGEERNAHRILVGKPEGKRPLGRPGSSWKDNIKMGLREIGWGGMNWIDLVQDRTGGGLL